MSWRSLEKGEKNAKNSPASYSEDLLVFASRETLNIRFLVLTHEYEKATRHLLELNKEFPEYGNYYFLRSFVYDRSKAPPPFAEAIANLKLPEPLVKDDDLERLRYWLCNEIEENRHAEIFFGIPGSF